MEVRKLEKITANLDFTVEKKKRKVYGLIVLKVGQRERMLIFLSLSVSFLVFIDYRV